MGRGRVLFPRLHRGCLRAFRRTDRPGARGRRPGMAPGDRTSLAPAPGSPPIASNGDRPARQSAAVVQALLFAHGPLSDTLGWLPDRGFQAAFLGSTPSETDRLRAEEIAAIVAEADGPVLAEAPSFAVAAGKGVVGNATHLRNLYDAGLWRGSALVADIDAHLFGTVLLNAELYPPPVLAAIGRSYLIDRAVVVGSADYHIFVRGEDEDPPPRP